MKRKVIVFAAITIIAVMGLMSISKNISAKVNPECPNGCVAGEKGCYCYKWYEGLAEAKW